MVSFQQRSTQLERMDDLTLSSDELHQTLGELSHVNRWLGGKSTLLNAINKIYRRSRHYLQHQRLSIVDLGCGGGDLLRAMKRWLTQRNYPAQLIGVDANAFTLDYAKNTSQAYPDIAYQASDIFSTAFANQRFDIITLNMVCHHFDDAQLATLLQQLYQQTNVAIVINDLHRHWLAYYAITWLTRLLPCSDLIRHDAPLSVLRAFRKRDLLRLFASLPKSALHIRWKWAFRWQVIVWCG